jgi:hypothetical protein
MQSRIGNVLGGQFTGAPRPGAEAAHFAAFNL